MFTFLAPKKAPPRLEPSISLNSFLEFYEGILKFKADNPRLKFGFLDHDNIEILKFNAEAYIGLEDFIPPNDLNAINEVIALKAIKEINGSLNLDPNDLKTTRDVTKKMCLSYGVQDYKNFIDSLNAPSNEDNLFYNIRQCAMNKNPEAQKEIDAIEQLWKRRKNFAFLRSDYLLKIFNKLNDFETYLDMVNDQFLLNKTYKIKAYAFALGVTDEKKAGLAQLVSQAREIIHKEYFKLCQAVITRLEVVPRKELLAAVQNDQGEDPVYDDVVCETAQSLRKFGLKEKRVQSLISKRRQSLNYELIRKFTECIVSYGNEEQKIALSELFNGPPKSNPVVVPAPLPDEAKPVQKPSSTGNAPARRNKEDALETLFPLIKKDAIKYFTPARFNRYEELHAEFITQALRLIDEDMLDNVNFEKISRQAYTQAINVFVSKNADELYPNTFQSEAKENFLKIAAELTAKLTAYDNFENFVIGKTQTRLMEDQQARLEVIINLRAHDLRESGIRDQLVNDFIVTARNTVKASVSGWVSLNANVINYEVDKVKDFILRKDKLISLLDVESMRINTKGIFSCLMSKSQTLEKSNALSVARARVEKVANVSDLQLTTRGLLQDKNIVQKRSIFSIFEKDSTTKKHLQTYLKSFMPPDSVPNGEGSCRRRFFHCP